MKIKSLYKNLLILAFLIFASCSSGMQKFTETRFKMGTIVQITVFEKDKNLAQKQIDRGFAEIDRVAKRFWEGNPKSDIYKFNNRTSDTVEVSQEVAALISRALLISKNTNGAFDMTVGTLKELYNFKKGKERIPDSSQVHRVLPKIGYKKLQVDLNKNLLISDNQDFKIITGAIVKGYAADRALRVITEENKNGVLVNAGGDICATKRKDEKNWIVGIQDPAVKNQLLGTISITEGAVVTSGDYEQFSIIDGKKYHHIINPLTGFSADKSHATTIVASNAELADALATGLFVLGNIEGLKVLEKYPDVECLWINSAGKIVKSDGFDNYMDE